MGQAGCPSTGVSEGSSDSHLSGDPAGKTRMDVMAGPAKAVHVTA